MEKYTEKLGQGKLPVYNVVATVKSMNGHCHSGYKIGDTMEISHGKVTGVKCVLALNSILPAIYMLRWGGQYPWSADPPVVTQECPDNHICVNFEVKRAGYDKDWHEYARSAMRARVERPSK